MDVKLATGIRVASQMEVVAAIQLMPDCVHNVTLRVVPELATSVVLGVPWLKEHNPAIDRLAKWCSKLRPCRRNKVNCRYKCK